MNIPSEQDSKTDPSGEQILERCAKTYLAVSEYVGECVVNSHSTSSSNEALPKSGSRTAQAHFDFKRGTCFNIQGHLTNDTPFSIESSPTNTILKNQVRGQEHSEECENLIRAVAAMTGVAATAPTTILALLTPARWGFPFRSGLVPCLKGHETIAGHDCFVVVQSSDTPARVRTYWIDSQSFLLRQMREERGENSNDEVEARRERHKTFNRERGLPDPTNYKIIESDTVHVFSIERVVLGVT
ncbi:hypothetical protein IAD21_02150 [Abditibacteriota bacterium]|nr:hypothetical protein IAD21_02150 [Abditibacteriota bacterium]